MDTTELLGELAIQQYKVLALLQGILDKPGSFNVDLPSALLASMDQTAEALRHLASAPPAQAPILAPEIIVQPPVPDEKMMEALRALNRVIEKLPSQISDKFNMTISGGGTSSSVKVMDSGGTTINPATQETLAAVLAKLLGTIAVTGSITATVAASREADLIHFSPRAGEYPLRDVASATITYHGFAVQGATTSASVWDIARLRSDATSGELIEVLYRFNVKWDDRGTGAWT